MIYRSRGGQSINNRLVATTCIYDWSSAQGKSKSNSFTSPKKGYKNLKFNVYVRFPF